MEKASHPFGVSGSFPSLYRNDKNWVRVVRSHAYTKPGTYFVALRGVSQRQGDPKTPFARLNNLARVRVVVT